MFMTPEAITAFLAEHDIQKVKYAFADIDGVLRGKVISTQKFLGSLTGDFGMCDVVLGWDVNDLTYDNGSTTGWQSGYPDAPARFALETFRRVPWDNDIPFLLADFSHAGEPYASACPRSLLKRVVAQGRDMGFVAQMAQEFEWFMFRESPQSLADKGYRNPEPLTPGMFGYSMLRPSLEHDFTNDLFDSLTRFDIPIEGMHTETGPGVYEAAIHHDDALRAADKAVLFKTSVKELAYRHGLLASFMAKWKADLPGCGGHIHQSLWTVEGDKNVFFDPAEPGNISELMQQYLAGQLHCMPHILPMFAPTINSYKRLVEGAWAPTTLTWSIDNRTTALRVLSTKEANCRVEHRVPGADTNPYLAMAASLASGLYGIRHGLELTIPASTGNGYADKQHGVLPANLADATRQMAESPVATELFGPEFVDHFTRTRYWETRQYAQHVSDWEMKRYFEII